MSNNENIIIIGAGQAGGMVAILLRKGGFKGKITLIGEESLLPYERPPLSKSYLTEEVDFKRLHLRSQKFYEDNEIKLISGFKIDEIDRNKNFVNLEDGRNFPYTKLIIATGSKYKELPIEPSKKINYLRNKSEADKIKSYLNKNKSVLIIGSGYIGLELAAVSIEKKLDTSMIELTNRVMNRSVSDITSDFFYNRHMQEGVNILLESKVEKLTEKNKIIEAHLSNKETIITDFLIIGIGVEPSIKLADDAGLSCKDGITVDKNCRTSDKNIFAIGDCSNQYNYYFNGNIRLESVDNAVNQAKIVAAYLTNNPIDYKNVPWFWTKQYNLNLQIAGFIKENYQKKVVGSMERDKFAVYHLHNQKLKAVEAVNSPKSFIRGKKLIKSEEIITNEMLV